MYICSKNGNPLSTKCPKCNSKDKYHIGIDFSTQPQAHVFTLCENCKDINQLGPIKINKKIIYLDQNCISEFAKLLMEKNHIEKFVPIYQKALLLVKNQLAIFPTSIFHTAETGYLSEPSQRKAIQNIIEQLSFGNKFKDPNQIIELELIQKINNPNKNLSLFEFLHEDPHFLNLSKFIISTSIEFVNGTFRDVFIEEINSYLKIKNISSDNILTELIQTYEKKIILPWIKKLFLEKNISLTDTLKNIEIIKIMALIIEQMSLEFFNGRKKDFDHGMPLDIIMISHTLPNVDAIYIDKEMYNLLNKIEYIRTKYKKNIFSISNIQDFNNFLNNIESNPPEYSYPPFNFDHNQILKAYNQAKTTKSLKQKFSEHFKI
ncbi:MAG: hypothetical protein ABIF12_02025 [bacterium]